MNCKDNSILTFFCCFMYLSWVLRVTLAVRDRRKCIMFSVRRFGSIVGFRNRS